MAVDEKERRRDMYEARLGPDDERIALGGRIYYVRAVKWERDFTRGLVQPVGEPIIDAFRLVTQGIQQLRASRRPWIVGVVRIGDVSTWNDVSPRLVSRETLAESELPQARIDDLVQQVKDGAFAPAP